MIPEFLEEQEQQKPMLLEPFYNKHYITIDNSNNIISGWSDGPYPDKDTTDAICISEKGGYQFRLFTEGEENPNLFDIDRTPLYKYEDGEIRKLTKVEKNIFKTLRDNKNLPSIKLQLITDSKKLLSQYLEQNPLIWTDKKAYSVTTEKQALLTEQLALYAMDPETTLYWNASGEPCHQWPIASLSALAKAIANYVRPFVQYQQHIETEINDATTAEEARSIKIDYSSVAR